MIFLSHGSIASTNEEAKRLYRDKRQVPITVTAREQTAGKGRNQRKWSSPVDKGIYLSYANTAETVSGLAFRLMLISSLAAAETILSFIKCPGLKIKWPNDILINGKKVCGILNEGIIIEKKSLYVMGIGINVKKHQNPGPEYAQRYEYLERYAEKELSIGDMASVLADRIICREKRSRLSMLAEYRKLLYRPDHDIQIVRPGNKKVLTGRVIDIDDEGRLQFISGGTLLSLNSAELLQNEPLL